MLEDDIRAVVKPQYVDHIPRAVRGTVGRIIAAKDQREVRETLMRQLELAHLADREVELLSGGELQRFAIGVVSVQRADVYMYDEPSSYLDVKQRLRAARVIRSMLDVNVGTYVITVEHDLSVLDYLSDFICCLYGTPGAYGVVTMPFSVREGINIFLAGFVPTENLRFRDESLTFKMAQTADGGSAGGSAAEVAEEGRKGGKGKKRGKGPAGRAARRGDFEYPTMTKTLVGKKKASRRFVLHVQEGGFNHSEIIVMLGENGTGKTTFIRMLAGLLKSDEEVAAKKSGDEEAAEAAGVPRLNVSYKPQKISPKFEGSVRSLLRAKVRDAWMHPQFMSDVVRPLNMDPLLDQGVKYLSGGELQRVAMVLCLSTPADLYLVDEPSAYLDSEQRIVCAKVIKRFILHAKKTAFVVEHDFIMATYLADRVVVYEGRPGVECTARAPESLLTGMNRFLEALEITFRRDPTNFRPRINKYESVRDREQKASGQYFFMDDEA